MLWDLDYSNFLIALKFGMWVSAHLSNFRAILYLKHPALWFRGLRWGAYLWRDVCYRWMLNVSVNISSGRKWLYVICCTYRSPDSQCETTIPDSVSDQLYFNGILKNIFRRNCRIRKRYLLTHCPNETSWGDIDHGQLWLRSVLALWRHQAITWTSGA